MLTKLFSFIILPNLLLSYIKKEYLPINGQINTVRFFVPKTEMCQFNTSLFNLRFKKCKIPIEFGNLIPEIKHFYNHNNMGMAELYNLFCVNQAIKSLNIFEEPNSKIESNEITENYPSSAIQVIHCDHDFITKENNKKQDENEQDNLFIENPINEKKKIILENLEKENNKTILVKFETQATEKQIKNEIYGDDKVLSQNDLDFTRKISKKGGIEITDDLFNISNDNVNEWINDVVGGYYILPYLDRSHFYQRNHTLFGSVLDKPDVGPLSSFDARPVAWMVLFEWENPHHQEKTIEQNYFEMKQFVNSNETNFTMTKESIKDFKKIKRESQKRNIERKMGIYFNERFILKSSNNHKHKDKKIISTSQFIQDLKEKIEKSKNIS